jgi:hypothetical protein
MRMKIVVLYTTSGRKDISAKGGREGEKVEEIRKLLGYTVEKVFGKSQRNIRGEDSC